MTSLTRDIRFERADDVRFLVAGALAAIACGLSVASSSGIVWILLGALALLTVLRRRPTLVWAIPLVASLFFYRTTWNTVVARSGSFGLHLSDVVVLALGGAALVGGLRVSRWSTGSRVVVGAAALFVLLVAVGTYRSLPVTGIAAVLQARHLLPFALVLVLPFSRQFSALSPRRVADVVAVALIALGARSALLVASGHQARYVPGVQRIFQTWEPFLAAALGLALVGFVLAGGRARALHLVAIAASAIPVVFSFFRTAWVLELAIAFALLVLVRGERGRGRVVGALLVCAAAVALVLLFPIGGSSHQVQEVVTRFHEIQPQLDSYRSQEYVAVWTEIKRHPLVGSGFATEYHGSWTVYRSWSHNAYEWVWWRIGALGLAAFLVLIGGAIALGCSAARRLAGDSRALAIGLTAALVFTALAANLHENFENYQTNLVLALIIARLLAFAGDRRQGVSV